MPGINIQHYFVLHVFIPNIAYNGQKFTRLVTIRINARIRRIYPNNPLTVLKINSRMNNAAKSNLIILSADPTFFFMMCQFKVMY